jgi:NTP pyrophosphatase (non-canonical NTP hydrolase)
MTPEQRRICLRAVDHFGARHQIQKAIEEMGELITELSRLQDKRTDKDRIRGELADVMIMSEQLRIIFGTADVDACIERKLEELWREKMRLPAERMPKGGSEDG